MGTQRGGKGHAPRGPTSWPHGGTHLPPRASFKCNLGLHGLVLTYNRLYKGPLGRVAEKHEKHQMVYGLRG
jgi:hypothetical protein